jgi:hypothetical protein
MPGAFRPLAVSLAHNIDNSGGVKSVNDFKGACLKARAVFWAISGEKMATECKQWAKKRRHPRSGERSYESGRSYRRQTVEALPIEVIHALASVATHCRPMSFSSSQSLPGCTIINLTRVAARHGAENPHQISVVAEERARGIAEYNVAASRVVAAQAFFSQFNVAVGYVIRPVVIAQDRSIAIRLGCLGGIDRVTDILGVEHHSVGAIELIIASSSTVHAAAANEPRRLRTNIP